MRQQRLHKTPRRRPRRVEPPAQLTVPQVPDTAAADELLERITSLLEA